MSDADSTLGEKVYQERREQREELAKEVVKKRFEGAYKALADGRRGDAVRFALYLYYTLQPDGLYLHDSEYFYEPLDDEEVPKYGHTGFHEMTHNFADLADEQGVETHWGWPVNPVEVLQWFDDWTHIGKLVWQRWAGNHSVGAPRRELKDALEYMELASIRRGVIEVPGEETYELGEDFEESPLHEMYRKRRRQGRSLQAIIVARDNDTGTGKTTLAVSLCKKWGDDWGAENATNRPAEYRDFLNNKPEGSVLLADEIGQMYDSRRSMSSENVEVSQDWQMIRTKRYITLSTLPGPSFLDKRLKKLADVMILATRRGQARVYRLKVDDQEGTIWREHLCNVEWGALDDDEDYQQVEQMKRERLKERFEGGGDDDPDEQGESIEDARRDGRNETIRRLVESGMTQTEIAEALEMDQSTVSRIVRESSD